eukprot:PLAT6433.3.p1 GENE.PLAT6433.3~~PLAT6433.3.p1  ORF type:complete len:775 (+),score=367.91 PLAT6433.3:81-2327(+)
MQVCELSELNRLIESVRVPTSPLATGWKKRAVSAMPTLSLPRPDLHRADAAARSEVVEDGRAGAGGAGSGATGAAGGGKDGGEDGARPPRTPYVRPAFHDRNATVDRYFNSSPSDPEELLAGKGAADDKGTAGLIVAASSLREEPPLPPPAPADRAVAAGGAAGKEGSAAGGGGGGKAAAVESKASETSAGAPAGAAAAAAAGGHAAAAPAPAAAAAAPAAAVAAGSGGSTAAASSSASSSSSASASSAAAAGKKDAFEISRIEVGVVAEGRSSGSGLLARMLRGGGGSGLGLDGDDSGGEDDDLGGMSLNVKIYLPDRSAMDFSVPEGATVEEAVAIILRQHAAAGREPALVPQPDGYELRLHDSDGYPEDDFALDQSRPIAHFGPSGDNEFCLVEIPGKLRREPDSRVRRMTTIMRSASVDGAAAGATLVKIRLPNKDYTIMALTPGMTVAQLVPTLVRKHSLPPEEYVVHARESDQVRLKMVTTLLDGGLVVAELGVEELVLDIKKYADDPRAKKRRRSKRAVSSGKPHAGGRTSTKRSSRRGGAGAGGGAAGGGAGGAADGDGAADGRHGSAAGAGHGSAAGAGGDGAAAAGRSGGGAGGGSGGGSGGGGGGGVEGGVDGEDGERPDVDGFIFNEISAGMYKEWLVVKTNKWGKKQRRIMGIDLTKIYNKREGGRSVKKGERSVADVVRIDFMRDEPRGFSVTFREGSEEVTIEYLAASSHEAAEIVAKVRYLQSLDLYKHGLP